VRGILAKIEREGIVCACALNPIAAVLLITSGVCSASVPLTRSLSNACNW
jgi:hypothetical protein